MNKQRVEQLLGSIRTRVENLAGAPTQKRDLKPTNEDGAVALYIYDRIGGWDGVIAKDVANALNGLGDVTVHINSPGGDIFEGAAIHNLLRNHKGTVTVRIDGNAASAASFIAMAGDHVVIEANATMMIHEGSALCVGNAQDMRDAADVLDLLSDVIAEMYAAKAGGTTESWRTKMRAETWFNAKEALAAGLVDEVASAGKADNALDLSIFDALTQPAAVPAVAMNTAPQTEGAGFADSLKEALA
ncbi:head maturation protease, ClpP-related [Lentzea aerocolonigenes]|uniref:head maturation protease, ClpP-related n=1 Tax=Lentzea aerocolonigenes TaxID=68170 RepID=UPI000695E838|nr:head maturation protease, ClpP-related [Lentzea aerocolonigenes]